MTRLELAQELQDALFARPQAGPIPISASLLTLVMEELRMERPPSGEMVTVPRVVIEFLRGTGHLEGAWFGENGPTGERGKFWWRKYLREAAEASKEPK